ncbi:MAG: cell division protein ZapE [Trueperaceae bacterium]|nr:MAG: cell division protein ZapE [Trueperaceae bacterium]
MAELLHLSSLSSLEKIPATALPEFSPPPRFHETHFESYRPQHPSQGLARQFTETFIGQMRVAERFRWPWQKSRQGKGLYLDGGFGVGKTHLLASAYHASPEAAKAYLSFQELVYLIGVLGMATAKEELGHTALLCIDEFELDDPGNTLIVKTFLAYVFEQGGSVITTSNTPPEALGRGRFNASDFAREIQSIAQHFEVVPIDGPDYRHRDHLAGLFGERELEDLIEREESFWPKLEAGWGELFAFLESVHPIRYRDLLSRVGILYLRGVDTIPDQNSALRFVHFIDKLYDLNVGLRASGEIPLAELYHPSYRNSAYTKKHFRSLSRLSELLEEPHRLQPDVI